MLQSLLRSFVSYASTQHHLEPILPEDEKVVNICFGQECYSLSVSRQAIEISTERIGAPRLVFRSKEDLQSFMSGRMRLQPLLRLKQVEYRGAYRTLLLIETIFHMCKPLERGA